MRNIKKRNHTIFLILRSLFFSLTPRGNFNFFALLGTRSQNEILETYGDCPKLLQFWIWCFCGDTETYEYLKMAALLNPKLLVIWNLVIPCLSRKFTGKFWLEIYMKVLRTHNANIASVCIVPEKFRKEHKTNDTWAIEAFFFAALSTESATNSRTRHPNYLKEIKTLKWKNELNMGHADKSSKIVLKRYGKHCSPRGWKKTVKWELVYISYLDVETFTMRKGSQGKLYTVAIWYGTVLTHCMERNVMHCETSVNICLKVWLYFKYFYWDLPYIWFLFAGENRKQNQ